MSYFPIDREILTSSLWVEGTPEQVKVWFYLMIAADPRSGVVPDADPAIAQRCGLPLTVVIQALDWLASPDPYSRTKEHDGRRIERLPEGGVKLLTYCQYRDKDYSTNRVRRWRDRQKEEKRPSLHVTPETTDTDTDTEKKKEEMSASSKPTARNGSRYWWDGEKKHIWGSDDDRRKLKAKWLERGFTEDEFKAEMAKLNRWLEDRPGKRKEGSNFANRINNWLNTALANLEAREVKQ